MKKLFIIILIILRIYILVQVATLLYLSHNDPEGYAIQKLNWWIYFLVFDIWLQLILPKPPEDETPQE